MEILQVIGSLSGGVYNAILAFEGYKAHQKWWLTLASAVVALGLFGYAVFTLSEL